MKKHIAVFIITLTGLIAVSVITAGATHKDVAVPYESLYYGQMQTMPKASGGDLRHYIIGQMPYKKDFKLWPGKGEQYKGTEPHASLLTTYVNDRALQSIGEKKGMINNSIVIKENYAPDGQLIAVTVMYKVKGYNPEGGDWFWAKYDAAFEVLAEGKVQECIACHGTVKDNDYIFTDKVTGK